MRLTKSMSIQTSKAMSNTKKGGQSLDLLSHSKEKSKPKVKADEVSRDEATGDHIGVS